MKIRVRLSSADYAADHTYDADHWNFDDKGHLLIKRGETTIAMFDYWVAVEVIEDE